MNEQNAPPKTIPNSLPAKRALVVQFRPAMPDGSVAFQGRVEHIASGRAEYFSDEQELLRVFVKLLSHGYGASEITKCDRDWVEIMKLPKQTESR